MFPLFRVRLPPALMVRSRQFAVAPITGSVVTFGMVTSSEVPGTEHLFQLAAVVQELPALPVHMCEAHALTVTAVAVEVLWQPLAAVTVTV